MVLPIDVAKQTTSLGDQAVGADPDPISPAGRRIVTRLGGASGVAGMAIILVVVVVALAAPLLASHGPDAVNSSAVLKGPSLNYPFGTDEFGRDVLSRVMYGLRTSLIVSVGSVLLATVVGLPLGVVAGYVGGVVDTVVMRSIDLLLAFPALLLAIVLIAMLGAGLGVTVVAVGIIFVPIISRVVRSAVLSIRGLAYVRAARSRGAGHLRIMRTHILPNVFGVALAQMSILTGFAILIEASLAFLGLGVQPPTPDLGSILTEGSNLATQAPWIEVAPGVILAVTILGFNLLGRGLQESLGVEGGR